MAKLLYLDLETTGLYPWKNAIVQISGEVEIDGVSQEKFNLLVKPFAGAIIEDTALKVNGRTREELETFDCPTAVFKQFRAMLERYVSKWNKKDKFFMVGYNSHSFDSQFLREFFKRGGEKYYDSYFWSTGHDVMLLAAYKLAEVRPEMKDFKLLTVARQLGIEVDESRLHDAEYDIEITKAMYWECSACGNTHIKDLRQEGRKDDKGKLDWALLPLYPIKEVIKVLMWGEKNYDRDNWQLVVNARLKYYNAAMRHITTWFDGNKKDSDTKLHHLAHAVCCLLFLMWFDKKGYKDADKKTKSL